MLRYLALAALGTAIWTAPSTEAAAAPPAASPLAPGAITAAFPAPVAQSLHKDERYGFQFKPPRAWRSIARKTEEAWLVAKYQSDKSYFYTDPAVGYTYEHTPEVLCIAFVHENQEKKTITEVEFETSGGGGGDDDEDSG